MVGYGETAIAEAARPSLGDAGFTMMAIAALLATSSLGQRHALRVRRAHRECSRARPVPALLRSQSRLGEHAGLLITAGLVLLVANLVDLSAIASVGSAIALMVFVLVGWRATGAAQTRAPTR